MESNTQIEPIRESELDTKIENAPIDESSKKPDSLIRESILFLRDITIILIVVLTIRAFLVAPFRISGSSMENNYFNGEFILVDKFSFTDFGIKINEPQRGDVVVIEPHAENGRQFYIKRIIGLPGEKLKIEDGKVAIQKVGSDTYTTLNETYLSEKNFWKTYPGKSSNQSVFEIPAWEYFIMGDNRNASADARDCFYTCSLNSSSHYLPKKDIVGKVWMSLWAYKIFDEFAFGRKIFDEANTSVVHIKLAKDIGFTTPPRFFNTPSTWNYPELN